MIEEIKSWVAAVQDIINADAAHYFYFNNLSRDRVIIIWQDDFTSTPTGVEVSSFQNEGQSVSPFGVVIFPPNKNGGISYVDQDVLKGQIDYAIDPRKLIRGDVVMLRTQYQESLQDEFSYRINGQVYYSYPIHDIIGIVDFNEMSIAPRNDFCILELQDKEEAVLDGVNVISQSFYENTENLGVVKWASYKNKDILGKKVLVDVAASAESAIFMLWENHVKIKSKDIKINIE